MLLPSVLKSLLSVPTAPFAEAAVVEYVQRWVARLEGVRVRLDRHGNLLLHYRRGPAGSGPLAFVAHLDHPGFIAQRMLGRFRLQARFHGGVKPEYFPGTSVRFWSQNRWVAGRVVRLSKLMPITGVPGWIARPEEAVIQTRELVAESSVGMWDLPAVHVRGGRLYAGACDDLAGVAALLTMLRRLSRKRARADVRCLFTRAEEAGFIGAIAAIRAGTLPRRVPVMSIETSSALPDACVGHGPILRVGDRATVFSSRLTAWCQAIAEDLSRRNKRFAFQRRLMYGGTCEATPFSAFGFEAGGICLALGNYHNMDQNRRRIAPEFVSLRDWQALVDWLEALATSKIDRDGLRPIRQRFDQRLAQYRPLLLSTPRARSAKSFVR